MKVGDTFWEYTVTRVEGKEIWGSKDGSTEERIDQKIKQMSITKAKLIAYLKMADAIENGEA